MNTSKERQEAAPATGQSKAKLADTMSRFEEAASAHRHAQQEAQRTFQRRTEDANWAYMAALNELQGELQRSTDEINQSFAPPANQSQATETGGWGMQPATADHAQALRKTQEEIRTRYDEAYRKYVDSLEQARKDAHRMATEAHRTYLRGLREVWVQVDVDALADTVAVVSYSGSVT